MVEQALQNLVEMRGRVKRYPGVMALDQVNFSLAPGEVHMLLGENGAGKSTLIKILSGAELANEGTIAINGENVDLASPHAALQRGLRTIYQEINLVQEIDIARNLFLGTEPLRLKQLGLINKKDLYDRAGEFLQRFHINLDPHELVRNLSVTQQKMVEIARALVSDVRVLILDEPTDVLEDCSRNDLFELIRMLKPQGVGFIYITHRYSEAHPLGDRITILRDGKDIGTWKITEITLDEMLGKMIGCEVKMKRSGNRKIIEDLPAFSPEIALKIKNIRRGKMLNGIDLEVRKGEIVAITGIDRRDSGEIWVGNSRVTCRNPADAIQSGITYLTEDRKKLGLILGHSIRDNFALPNIRRLSRFGLLRHRQIDREIDTQMQALKIKAPDRNVFAGGLSGGNQQKVVIAKWLGTNGKVIIFDEPTRGIDIVGRREVHRIIRELLAQDVGILFLTSDFEEALEMGPRIVVLHRGTIAAEFARNTTTEEDILRVAIGTHCS